VAALSGMTSTPAADAYPTRPVRIVVPFAPGGGLDLVSRLLGQKMGEAMQQTAIIDNRTGAGGNIGAEIVAKAAPDGYTILSTSASLAVNASLYPKLNYDTRKDFAPVALVASVPHVLVVGPTAPGKTLKDLVAAIRAKPGAYTFASNGAGTTSHLSGELLNVATGAKLAHVPFKGGGPASVSVSSGETNLLITTIPTAMPQIKAGRVLPLAVTSAKPAAVLPGVPTMASVIPGYETDNWYGVFVPAATPKAIVERLNREIVQALKATEVREVLLREGSEPIGSTSEAFVTYFASEIVKYAKVVKASGATAN
jgi:tripartite-type tricarboxylate transporter receptor subunit TctC